MKTMLERMLPWPAVPAGSLLGLAHRPLLRNTLAVFVYHDVTDRPSPFSEEFGLNVPPARFDAQIAFIARHFNVISADDLLEDRVPPRAALITFDDGFESVVRTALPSLNRLGIPSLVFLNMGPVNGDVFWAGLIQYLCTHEPEFRREVAAQAGPHPAYVPLFLFCTRQNVRRFLDSLGDERCARLFLDVNRYVGPFATADLLLDAAKSGAVCFGNHLYNHDVARWLSDEELIENYARNEEALSIFPCSRPLFAFPFGDPTTCFDTSQVDTLLRHGARKVFSCSGLINDQRTAAYLHRVPLFSAHDRPWRFWYHLFVQASR